MWQIFKKKNHQNNKPKNLISVDQLSVLQIQEIHKKALKYFEDKKFHKELLGKILVNFFFENSTRTRLSFEIAAKKMGMEVVNIDISLSSLKKGETILDMARTVNAMNPDFIAVRHNSSGVVNLLKNEFDGFLINAGDGTNEHPTQALLDSFVIMQKKGKIAGLKIAICGDIIHSRVARSNIKLLHKMGAKIILISPPTLINKGFEDEMTKNFDAEIHTSLENGIKDVDVVMLLRIQQERMSGCYISSLSEYFKFYGLNHEKFAFAKKDAIILHPGPINRGVEISEQLADDLEKNVILTQVSAGVAIRQALFSYFS